MREGLALMMIGCWSSSPKPAQSNPVPTGGLGGDVVIPSPAPPLSLEVLGLSTPGPNTSIADQLTTELRAVAGADVRVRLGRVSLPLADVQASIGCMTTQTRCVTAIANLLNTERIVFGELTGSYLVVSMFDVKRRRRIDWTGTVNAADLRATAREAITLLLGELE